MSFRGSKDKGTKRKDKGTKSKDKGTKSKDKGTKIKEHRLSHRFKRHVIVHCSLFFNQKSN
jgi:hypothetical protein